MKTRFFFMINLLLMAVVQPVSVISQNSQFASIDSLDALCLRCNKWAGSIYSGRTIVIEMSDFVISEYLKNVEDLVGVCRTKHDSLITPPLIDYYNNGNQYLTRFLEIYPGSGNSIAPFQYNELKLLYSQLKISRSTLASAISYSGMMKEIAKSLAGLETLKSSMNTSLQKMQSKIDTNFKEVTKSVDTLHSKAIKIDQAVKKNKNKLNWTLGITTATGVLAIAILLITLLH